MSKRWHKLALRCILPAAAILAGCTGASNRTVRMAGAAEERGEAHVAYDVYCQAARQDPGDVRVVSALKRLAPTAAAYWDSQARIAASKGEYGDAWRMGVKSLDIRPDQPGMADFIRHLEADHPDAVALARREWERTGKVRVASAPANVETREEPRQVAAIQEPEPEAESEPPQATMDHEPKDEPQPVASGQESEPEQQPVASVQEPESASPPAPSYNRPPRTYRAAPPRTYQASRNSPREAPRNARPPAAQPPSAAPREESTNYIVMFSLSRRGKAFPERLRLADGIYMKLRDVNDDNTADMDLDDGDDRVQKIREMKEGQSKLFRGQSGRWYRFTLVDVQARGEVVRIGLQPG